jgi:hypothetical protein
MEDYIFLIIAIVLSIFGAINQNKKKKVDDNPFIDEVEEPRNRFMDQLLGRDFLDGPVATKAPPPRIKPIEANVATQGNGDTQRGKFYHQVFKSTLPDRPKHQLIQTTRIKKEEEESVEVEESINYLEDFSLRKAFVYSEIMNRKYFSIWNIEE